MCRINPDFRKPPKPEDVKVNVARISRRKRKPTDQQKRRMTADEEYNAISDIYKEQNFRCVRCGRVFDPDNVEGLENDHIVCGTAGRSASLLNCDTWILQCHECHGKAWSVEEKAAAKLKQCLAAIERLRGRNFTDEENKLIIKRLRAR